MAEIQNEQECAHALTIERLAGKMLFVDPAGQSWGIKIFTLREHETFFYGLHGAIVTNTPVAWARFAQKCVVAHSERPGIKVAIRRALGLYDYSAVRLYLKLTNKYLVEFRDAVVYANTGKSFTNYANDSAKPETPSGKAKRNRTAGWGEVMASNYFNNGIMPDEFLGMTLPQLEAITEYGKREAGNTTRRNLLEDLKERMGTRRG